MKSLRKNICVPALLASILFISSCQTDNRIENTNLATSNQYSKSTEGMVSSANPLATAAGKEILEQGGNAADAAVATAFALAVVEPEMSGLGGRLQAIIRTGSGDLHGIDATTQAPMTYDPKTAPQAKYGYAVIGIPGVVAGLTKLNKDYGSLPLKVLMAPAIKYAEEGINLLPGQAMRHAGYAKMLLESEGAKQYFIRSNDTVTYGSNDLLVQKDLAKTLKMIAENGPDAFYKGEIAEKMVADIAEHNGAVTMESLADYEALDSKILSGSYRGHEVYGLWMPSFGAITIEILQILENLPMGQYTDAEWASAIYQAIKIAYEDRFKQISMADGKYLLDVGEHLIEKEYAKEQAQRIQIGVPAEASILEYKQEKYLAYSDKLSHTTHLSVADKNGMVVSLTQSLGPLLGSRVATPGLGFLYAATLGGYLGPMQPGQRAASHISPMILTTGGEAYMGIGAAGGARINSAIIQVISRVVDQNLNLYEALEAARVHPLKEGLAIETHDSMAWHPDDLQFLRDNGFLLEEVALAFKFGRVHAVMKEGDKWVGAADPDGEGAARGPDMN